MAPIGEDTFDTLRHLGDPEADALAAHYLGRKPSDLFHGGLAAGGSEGPPTDPVIAEWLARRPELPPWADRERMRRGAHFYNGHGIPMGLGLFLSSLPLAYASHDGVQALALTARLETNARRRILETAQFVIDVTRSDALEPGGRGYETARRIRLVHAGVRQLITSDSRIAVTSDPSVSPRWDPAWGVPVNQEHLIGTMISFTVSLLHVLDKLHISYSAEAADDYCHLWSVVGWLLGIDPALLPMERADLERLEPIIRARNEQASEAGAELTSALLGVVRSFAKMPLLGVEWPGSRKLTVSAMRMFIGDETADLLRVPPPNWTRVLLKVSRPPRRRWSLGLARIKLLRTIVRRVTRVLFKGFVYSTRDGGRPAFDIPVELGFASRAELKYSRSDGDTARVSALK